MKYLVFLSILFLSIGMVSASDIDLNYDEEISDEIIISNVNVTDNTFQSVETAINAAGVGGDVKLTRDVIYEGNFNNGNGIKVNKNGLTIDGNGYAVNGNGQSRLFYITGDNVTIKNIKLINGYTNETNPSGPAIYCTGNNLNVISCSFSNNVAYSVGGAIYLDTGSNITTISSDFTNDLTSNNINSASVGSKIDGYNIIVTDENGNEFNYVIKGVAYSRHNNTNGIQDYQKYFEDDLKKLKALNANSVRTYRPLASYYSNGQINYAETKHMLDRFAEEGITVVVGFDLNQDMLTGLYKNYIGNFSNHPAILMWAFGNEYNYHPEWVSEDNWMNYLNEATNVSKQLSPNKITAVVHGELPTASQVQKYNNIVNLDLIMLNIYKGNTFYDLFTNWGNLALSSTQPLVMSEFGRSSKSPTLLEDTSQLQADTLNALWLEIEANLNGVSAGGFIFELNDEAWKGNGGIDLIGSESHLGLFYDQFTNILNDSKPAAHKIANLWGGNLSSYQSETLKTYININVNNTSFNEMAIVDVELVTGDNILLDTFILLTVNGQIRQVNIIQGKGSLNLTNLNAGNYQVTANFTGDGHYLPSTSSNSFNISKIDPEFGIKDIALSNNMTLVITISPNATGELTVIIAGILTPFTVPIVGGKATISGFSLIDGIFSAYVTYNGDINFNNKSESLLFATKPGAVLTANDIVMYYKDGSKYIINLKDSEGNPITNTNVLVNINGNNITRTTDNNGQITVNINLSPGKYINYVYFDGVFKYAPVSINNTLEIKSTMAASDITKYYLNDTHYYATITDNTGKLLTNAQIKMNINGKIYERETDDKGIVKLSINLVPGIYTITINDPHSDLMLSNQIIVLSTIDGADITKYYKNGTQYYATLLDSYGNPLKNRQITMNINGVMYGRNTDENGTVMLTINLNPKTYIITVIHPDNGEMHSNTIIVLPTLTGNDVTMTGNDRQQFLVRYVDGNGNPLEGIKITININGIFYDRVTDSTGFARLAINLDPGSYIATATYDDYSTSNIVKVNP